MKLVDALKRVGGEVVKRDKTATSMILFLRIQHDSAEIWADAVANFLLSDQAGSSEIAKVFFADRAQDSVRYLWRIILRGELREVAEALGQACISAGCSSVELKSFPLVGRKNYVFDPARGKMAGGHSPSKAAAALATHGVGT